MISIKCEILHELSVSPRKLQITQVIQPAIEKDYWNMENFLIRVIILDTIVFDKNTNKVKIDMDCEGVKSNALEMKLKSFKTSKVRYKDFENQNTRPLLKIRIKLPDLRFKFKMDYALHRICDELVRHQIQ